MKTHSIKFRCTEAEFSKIKALGVPDMSSWILSKLLPMTLTGVEAVKPTMSVSIEEKLPVTIPVVASPTCVHCSKPGSSRGWHNGVIVWFCKDHS